MKMATDGLTLHSDSTHETFDDERFWLRRDDDGLVLGISEVGLAELGRLQTVKFPHLDQECDEGDVICTIIGEDSELQLVAPSDCVVEAINKAVLQDLEVVADDPFEEGWLVKLV